MDREKVVERVLTVLNVSESQLDLVGKLLELESHERVHSVEIFDRLDLYAIFMADVYLHDDFEHVGKFRKFLIENELPPGQSWKLNGVYQLKRDGVLARFYVPDSYPKK